MCEFYKPDKTFASDLRYARLRLEFEYQIKIGCSCFIYNLNTSITQYNVSLILFNVHQLWDQITVLNGRLWIPSRINPAARFPFASRLSLMYSWLYMYVPP